MKMEKGSSVRTRLGKAGFPKDYMLVVVVLCPESSVFLQLVSRSKVHIIVRPGEVSGALQATTGHCSLGMNSQIIYERLWAELKLNHL